MMDAIQILAGLVLLALVYFDFVKTAIATTGMGPVSGRLAALEWQLARRLVPWLNARTGMKLERAIGPAILCTIAAVWVLTSWTGYSLLFAASGALDLPGGGSPAVAETIAFAGSSLSTLGASLANPGNGWWDILTAVAAINGMVVLTLSISFMMNVWQTMTKARALSLRIAALDSVAPQLDAGALDRALGALAPALIDVAVGIRGVPVVAYFSTDYPSMNLPRSLAILCGLVERAGSLRASPEGAELWHVLAVLAEQQDGAAAGDDPIPAVRRWAEEHCLPA